MVAIYGPVVTHRAPYGSYMQRELYAALHYNLHFIDSQVLMLELKEDDAELYLDLAQLLQQRRRRRRTPRRVWVRPWILRRGGVSLETSDAFPSFREACFPIFSGGILGLRCGQNIEYCNGRVAT